METKSLRHIVMMQFKEDTNIAEIDEIVRRFVQLKEHIGEIEGIEWGTNNSPSIGRINRLLPPSRHTKIPTTKILLQ